MEKSRVSKGYRHPALDQQLRSARVRMEARLMSEARKLGVPVPIVYDIDLAENKLLLEYVEGPTVKEFLEGNSAGARELCYRIGRLAGKLHSGDLVHGDLTTSNMVIHGERVYLIDFGLGERRGDLEAKGVDLHLLKEAFMSAHSEMANLFEDVLRGYKEAYEDAEAVIAKSREIERRGRYLRGS